MLENKQHYIDQGILSDTLTRLIEGSDWAVFKEQVLDEMYTVAFDGFQKVDPTKYEEVLEFQQMARTVTSIEDRINNLVQAGRLAQECLRAELPDEEEPYE